MPLTPQYCWRQTPNCVVLSVDLHNNSYSAVDVVDTTDYVKVSFLPYFLEVFLYSSVDDTATLTRPCAGRLELLLYKVDPAPWPCLHRSLSAEATAAARQAALQELSETLQRRQQHQRVTRVTADRRAVGHQMAVTEAQRSAEQRLQQRCTRDFFAGGAAEADGWQSSVTVAGNTEGECGIRSSLSLDQGVEKERRLSTESCEGEEWTTSNAETNQGVVGRRVSEDREYDGDGEDHDSDGGAGVAMLSINEGGGGRRVRRPISRRTGGKAGDDAASGGEAEDGGNTAGSASAGCITTAKAKKPRSSRQPGIRAPRNITVTYTSRPDALPARQSRDGTAEAGRDDGKEEEGGSEATLQRGMDEAKSLFESGQYSDSVAAYSTVLSSWPDHTRALSNRAAAHLAAGSPHLALQDANRALSLLGSPSTATAHSRLLCLSRRGAAHAALGQLSQCLSDYEAALSLRPHDQGLKRDIDNVRREMETSEGSSWVETEEEEPPLL